MALLLSTVIIAYQIKYETLDCFHNTRSILLTDLDYYKGGEIFQFRLLSPGVKCK